VAFSKKENREKIAEEKYSSKKWGVSMKHNVLFDVAFDE